MDLNLRKARKLESKVANYIEKVEIKLSIEVRAKSSLEEAQSKLKEANQKLLTDIETLRKLNEARFNIRSQIANTNQGVGINALMTEREALKAKVAILTKLNVAQLAPASEELADLLESKQKLLEKGGDVYGRNVVTVDVPVVTEVERVLLADEISSTIKALEDVEDQLAQKNLGAKVTLSADTVTLLKSNNLM